ncbi:neurofilament light polypeptide [Gouania willdenowi]|uniref:Neurofilament light polypeptide-like n=1 Tax=Gouania willdenowi TaxID=441366 RepID=A0A8C5DMD1_GOUWI|nr:neurofilament light polypeptide-like [Gouania willdenowi]
MTSNSVFSSRRPWNSYRGNSPSSTSLYPSSASSVKKLLRMDLAEVSTHNTELLSLRSQEREQLVNLNDRFVGYIEKVRHLEQQNRSLLVELETLRKQQNNPSRLQALYEGEVRSLKAMIHSENMERGRMEAERDYLRDVFEQMKERCEEEEGRRLDTEEVLQRAREEMSNSELYICDAQASVVSLCEELLFQKKVFAVEQAELQAQLQMVNISVEIDTSRPDLTTALRDIRAQYETLANKNMRSAEGWYQSKVANIAEMASKNSEAVHAIRQETMEYRRMLQLRSSEIEALRNAIGSLTKQLEDLEETQAKEVTKYQEKILKLEEDISDAKQEMTHYLREYQDLLNVKMALDIEIAAYRKLLEGEEIRLAFPSLPTLN